MDSKIFKMKNGSEVLIRSYEEADVDLVNAFSKTVALESTHTLKYEGMPSMSKDKLVALWRENASHPVDLSLGVFVDQKVIGNIRFYQKAPNHPWVKHVGAFGMAILREYWGQGLGTQLLQIIESHARTCGISRIEAEVRTANEAGVSLYTKNGFKIEGRREKAAMIDGVFVDEFYIAKIL